ncbi:S49 family peptidase [Larkinella sp. GY13]|uniref:S49 family peptidase n=1 Tax=Larkinella sp. GY13 TaxID=3453720 RepID=UPI003EEB1675
MLETLLSAKWALEPLFHERMADLALRRLLAGKPLFDVSENRQVPRFVSTLTGHDDVGQDDWGADRSAAVPGYSSLSKVSAKSGRVVVLPIMGTMSRYGGLCAWGSEDTANWVLEANRDETISAIVLEINSPGGEVDGTEMLGEVVRRSGKPVVAWVAGMAASAAYWVASQAREIIMESPTSSEVGSIGVLAMHVDASQYYQQEGLSVNIIRADGSEDKALFNSIEPLSDAVRTETKTVLNDIRQSFIKTVQRGRPGISRDVFSGKMYSGRQALTLGMADRIGFLGDAIRRADQLAKSA